MKPESDSYHENQPVVRQGSLPHGTIELDDVDRRIMKLLRHDARLSYAHVARTVGLSEPTVRKRIDRLVHAGAIINAARINPAPIGFPIDAMIGISVVRGRVKEVGRKLAQMENVAYVAYVAGNFDIIIEAFLPHTEGLFKFLNEDLEKIDGIASYADLERPAHREVLLQLGGRGCRPGALAGRGRSGRRRGRSPLLTRRVP